MQMTKDMANSVVLPTSKSCKDNERSKSYIYTRHTSEFHYKFGLAYQRVYRNAT